MPLSLVPVDSSNWRAPLSVREGRFPRVVLCYVAGNEAAPVFYARLGFTPETGDDFDEDEPGMGLEL